MDSTSTLTNQPGRQYDRPRVEQLQPMKAAIAELQLPPIRFRKLNGIVNALEMQIEDGVDSPEVNRLLLDALRAGVMHQVGKARAQSALQAIFHFKAVEARRWERVRAGTLPPIERTPQERMDDLLIEAADLMQAQRTAAACDRWLEAWELVKALKHPKWRTIAEFDRAYRGRDFLSNWCRDLEMELGNAAIDDPSYHEKRLRYAREIQDMFSDEDDHFQIMIGRAEGEALFGLGRNAEADAVYEGLVNRFPDEAWAYIGWSDNYCWPITSSDQRDYARAEAILLRALQRPHLTERIDVLDRLDELYKDWNKPEKRAAIQPERERLARKPAAIPTISPTTSPQPTPPPAAPAPVRKLGRNELCWCGSGKKYKHCHMHSDGP